MYLLKPHISIGDLSRSMSQVKVKCQKIVNYSIVLKQIQYCMQVYIIYCHNGIVFRVKELLGAYVVFNEHILFDIDKIS